MGRGFVSGVIWGGVVGALGLAAASQLAPPPAGPRSLGGPDALAAAPAPDALPAVAESPSAPITDAPAAPVQPAAEPDSPELSVPVPEPVPAAAVDEAIPAEPFAETTAEPTARAAEPVAPASDLTPPAGSEFARPLPEVDPVLPGPETDVAVAKAPVVTVPDPTEPEAPDTSSALRPEPAMQEPAAPQAPATDPSTPTAVPGELARTGLPSGAAQPGAPEAESAPGAADLPPPPPLTPEEEAMLAGATEEAAPGMLVPNPPLATAEPAPPAPGLDGAAEVTTNRLPRIGDAPAVDQPAEALPPIKAFARSFDNPDKKPLFAILLVDTGGPGVDRESLAALPFPVSFVIDPLAPDAATAAAIYRKAGQEVLMLATGIPDGATASDLEVTFAAHAKALPEAVALVDLPDGGFQENRQLSAEVVTVLDGQGRGLLTQDRGLNAADQVARREGIPAAVIFRRLDADGEAAPAIGRYLDRAAFKAAQDGRVTVIGTTRPETVQALLTWSVEGRASSVALAPATAALGQ